MKAVEFCGRSGKTHPDEYRLKLRARRAVNWFDPDFWKVPAALVDDWKTILVGAVAIVGSLIAIFRSGLKSIRSICGRARRRTGLKYLPENDIGLMTAIEGIATTSSWARWYAAKLLTINERCLLPRASIFRSVASELARALRDGKLRSGAS